VREPLDETERGPVLVGRKTGNAVPSPLARGSLAEINRAGDGHFRADVQGLRGISVLIVVLYHAGLGFPGGFIGVDVFFVISGYVIGRGLISEADATGRVRLSRFYARRVRRILPALATMLIVVTALVVVVMAPAFPQPNALRTARAAALSGSNLFLWAKGGGYFDPVEEGNPFVHTWSLGVEEQFYFFFPLFVLSAWFLARLVGGGRHGRQLFGVTAIVLTLVSLLCSLAWTYEVTPIADAVPGVDRFAFYGPLGRVWEFLVGALIALWVGTRPTDARGFVRASLGILGLGLIAGSSLALSANTAFPGLAVVAPVAGAALVIASGTGLAARLLDSSVLVWLGDRSYSWYLWHWPLIVLAPIVLPSIPGVAAIAAIVSLVPAVISYNYVERPFRAVSGVRWRIAAPKLATACIAVPVVFTLMAMRGSNQNWGLDPHPELSAESISQRYGCYAAGTPIDSCTFGISNPHGTIMLVGDSHADVISDAVVEAGNAEGYDVVIQTFLACPFVTTRLDLDQECLNRQLDTYHAIQVLRPDVLVIANHSNGVLGDMSGEHGGDVYDPPAADVLEVWQQAMTATLQDVEPHVGRVVLYSVAPYFSTAEFDSALPTLLHPNGRSPAVDVDLLNRGRGPILAAEQRAIDATQLDVTVVDPLPQICDADECALRADNGEFVYRDPNHVSNPFARELTPLFEDVFLPRDG
jgi:peptidoglycan/LPS O-acetylase OafA/YrhL